MQTVGVVLAGGRATRMGGGDKGALMLDGRPLLTRCINRLAPQVDHLVLNANGDPTRFAQYGLDVVCDSIPGFAGPLAGVLAGMDWAAEQGADFVISVAVDTPFFPQDLVKRLRASGPLALAATPDPVRKPNRHPTFGLWPVALREDLRAALRNGLRKVVVWTEAHGAATVSFPVDRFDPFFNINTPEDLTAAEALL